MSTSEKVIRYFIRNPLSKPKDVALKFNIALAYAYVLRKKAMHGAQEATATEVLGPQVEDQPANKRQEGGDHYVSMPVQPWDVVDTWPIEQRIGFYRGNAMKYLMRMGSKDMPATEAAKGMHYIQKLVEVLNERGAS